MVGGVATGLTVGAGGVGTLGVVAGIVGVGVGMFDGVGVGVVSILAAIASLCSLFGIAKTRLMVYDYHLEGSYYIPILGLTIRRDYYVKYQDIAGITRNQNVLIIHMVGTQQRIAVKNNQMAETAHQMIQQCIDYMKYSQQNQGTVN